MRGRDLPPRDPGDLHPGDLPPGGSALGGRVHACTGQHASYWKAFLFNLLFVLNYSNVFGWFDNVSHLCVVNVHHNQYKDEHTANLLSALLFSSLLHRWSPCLLKTLWKV